MAGLDDVLGGLLEATGASRATLRRDIPGEEGFPVVARILEAMAGVELRDE